MPASRLSSATASFADASADGPHMPAEPPSGTQSAILSSERASGGCGGRRKCQVPPYGVGSGERRMTDPRDKNIGTPKHCTKMATGIEVSQKSRQRFPRKTIVAKLERYPAHS
jgi:hypothetical protein